MVRRELKAGTNGPRLAIAGAYESYIYDSMNRVKSVTREDGKIDSFDYNNAGELKDANYQWSGRSVSYNLDLVGNRNSVTDAGVTKNYMPDAINRYSLADSASVTSGPEHQVGNFQGNSYQYVGDTYLARISGSAGTYTAWYDALGRCAVRAMTVNGNTTYTYFIYDGEKPILEYDLNGGLVGTNVYGKSIDEILMRTESPSGLTYYYQDDHEGSVTHLMLANGTVIESYRYDAFGAPTITTAQGYSPNNRFMFTGREYIKQFAIYEYRARAYHPGIGRFMSEDPKGFDGGDYNLFRYCENDPLDLTDPMGLATAPLTSPIGAQQDKNNKYYKLHPSSFTTQLLEGPGIPSGGRNYSYAQLNKESKVAGQLERKEGLGKRYDSFTEAGEDYVNSNWDNARRANPDAKNLQEHNWPVGQEQGFTKGHVVVGNLVAGDIKRAAATGRGDIGFNVSLLAANLPVGSNLIGYITIHPNADFEKKVLGNDIGVVNSYYGIRTKVYYHAPRSITNWSRYDAGQPHVVDD